MTTEPAESHPGERYDGRMGMSSVAAWVARLEQAGAASAERVVVVINYNKGDPEDAERQVAEGATTGATAVLFPITASP